MSEAEKNYLSRERLLCPNCKASIQGYRSERAFRRYKCLHCGATFKVVVVHKRFAPVVPFTISPTHHPEDVPQMDLFPPDK